MFFDEKLEIISGRLSCSRRRRRNGRLRVYYSEDVLAYIMRAQSSRQVAPYIRGKLLTFRTYKSFLIIPLRTVGIRAVYFNRHRDRCMNSSYVCVTSVKTVIRAFKSLRDNIAGIACGDALVRKISF